MKSKIKYLLVILVLGTASCIPSLFPLYTQKDIIFDDRIIGFWDGGFEELGIWKIEKLEFHPKRTILDRPWSEPDEESDPENISYRLTVMQGTEDKDTSEAEFILHLLELGDYLYMNIFPQDFELHHGFLSWHMIEAHTFMRVYIDDQKITMRFFDPAYLEDLIDQNKIRIDHVRLDGILLTAPTRDLQKFVLKYSDEEGALQSADILNRIS